MRALVFFYPLNRTVLYNLHAHKEISGVLLSQRSWVLSICRQTSRHFVSQNGIIQFEVLLPAHFLFLNSDHLYLSLRLTIYEEEISGQSKLAAKCCLSYDCASTLAVQPALKQTAERTPSSSKPDLHGTPSIIHTFTRLSREMHGQASSLLALNLLNHSARSTRKCIPSPLSLPHTQERQRA